MELRKWSGDGLKLRRTVAVKELVRALERMQNKMNTDFEILIRLMKEHGKLPSSSDESVESVRPRRMVSISPGEIVRLPNGGDEMRVSRLSSHEPPTLPTSRSSEDADTLL
ncbi:hypothetical protein Y032_0031g2352 [Ancylostoma ceylanicum]|uniref:Uncharacterized protein n=2 Tax=Ancylostoma TaxID=29169 RepID=A0A016UPB3_9BILA|nr:hypothetical protein Y032_0031g2352 [Ancylostoma ceylanicum]